MVKQSGKNDTSDFYEIHVNSSLIGTVSFNRKSRLCRVWMNRDLEVLDIGVFEQFCQEVKVLVDQLQNPGIDDASLFDWLDWNSRYCVSGWVCRWSKTGRGIRVHQASDKEAASFGLVAKPTAREAISDAVVRHMAKEAEEGPCSPS